MSGVDISFSNELCYSLEKDYFQDNDIKNIIRNGLTPLNLLEASKLIKQKENSPLIKLSLDYETDLVAESIENLQDIVDIACSSGSLKMAINCIENAQMEDILLKVQAPFSMLLSLVGSNLLFKWLCKYKKEMHLSLNKIANSTADYCIEAIKKGANIISLADPSAMPELLGEAKYKEFVGQYMVVLLKKLEPYLENSLVHICPRTSIPLEKYGFMVSQVISYERENYGTTLLQLAQYSNIKFVGHRCVNADTQKGDRVYILKVL